jgi:MFS family permease
MLIRFFSKLFHALATYFERIMSFRLNAWLYLLNVIITGAAMGVFRLLFNFYALSLGFNEELLGNLVTTSSLTALGFALPMGYLADRLGRKASLISSGALMCLAMAAMVLWPQASTLYVTNIIFGIAQSLAAVSMSPFLMENSGELERTYLFSFASGLQMVFSSVGNWVGGYLPTWVAQARGVGPTHQLAYGGSLLLVAIVAGLGLLPLLFLRTPNTAHAERTVFAPLSYAAKHPAKLTMLILPMLVTSIGAGLIMPFMNVFFRMNYAQPDDVIGRLFALGSVAMGVGLLAAPPLAERMGKIQLVVVTQALSIPFLVLLGFAPWFWLSLVAYLVRVALMNMSSPVYQTFVMEHVDPDARATVASLVSMSWNFGWAVSPTVSGWLQARSGFTWPFIGTIALYIISVFLYWFFWARPRPAEKPTLQPQTGD